MMDNLPKPFAPVASVFALIVVCCLVLAACSSSSKNSSPNDDDPVPWSAAVPSLTFHSVKTFRFSWSDVSDADYYKLLENPDGVSGFSQVGGDVYQGTEHTDHIVPLYARMNAQYILQSCTNCGCVDSDILSFSSTLEDSIGYFKASNTDGFIETTNYYARDAFGKSVSLSADAKTLAVGAPDEWSNATGVDGDQSDNSIRNSGAVYVFVRGDNGWSQQAYLKASNTLGLQLGGHGASLWGYAFGTSISLSADGNTLAVGAPNEHSDATGFNGDQANTSALGSGAAYVFFRSGDTWSQQAYLKASNTGGGPDEARWWSGDRFGGSLSLSADGKRLAVGAAHESSSATGINGDPSDDSAIRAGAVYVFTRSENGWSQQAYIKASNTDSEDLFGLSVCLSGDGHTLAVGAPNERSLATGVDGDQSDNAAWESAGALYVFFQSGSQWHQQAYIKASNTDVADFFASAATLSSDGNTLAVGAAAERSSAVGVNGDQSDNSADRAGAVYVFIRSAGSWSQQAYLKASNTDPWDYFGDAVSLSADGYTLAVSATHERSNTTGVNADQRDNSAWESGAVYVFSRTGDDWRQQSYLKASNSAADDYFGRAVGLSGNGKTLAVGAPGESSIATGVDGDQSDNVAEDAGAVYLF